MTLTELDITILDIDRERVGLISPGRETVYKLNEDWEGLFSEVSACFDYYLQGRDMRPLPVGNQLIEITKEELGNNSRTYSIIIKQRDMGHAPHIATALSLIEHQGMLYGEKHDFDMDCTKNDIGPTERVDDWDKRLFQLVAQHTIPS